MENSLIVIGVALLIAEIFLPSGFFGVSGFVLFTIGVFMVAHNPYVAIVSILISIAILTLILMIFVKSIPKNSLYKTLLLKTKLGKEEGVLSSKENDLHLGEIMEVDTFLRPSGKIKKDGIVYDAMSDGVFIEKGEKVEVIGNKGYILLVKKVDM